MSGFAPLYAEIARLGARLSEAWAGQLVELVARLPDWRVSKLDKLDKLDNWDDLRGHMVRAVLASEHVNWQLGINGRFAALDRLATGVPALRVQRGVFAAAGSVTIAAVDPAKAFILSVSKGSAGYVAPSGGLMARITGGTTMQVEGWSTAAISFGGGSTNLTARAYSAVLANATTVTADGPCEWQLVEGY